MGMPFRQLIARRRGGPVRPDGRGLAAPSLLAQARERTLFVSALDKDGKPVEGLGPDAFVVREDGDAARGAARVARHRADRHRAARGQQHGGRPTRSPSCARPCRRSSRGWRRGTRSRSSRWPTGRRFAWTTPTTPPRLTGSVGSLFSMPNSGMTLLDAHHRGVARGWRKRETPRAVIVPVVTDGTEFTNRYSPGRRRTR